MPTLPSRDQECLSVLEIVQAECDDKIGIVHRLDKDTSGLMIIAKNMSATAIFNQIFQNRRIHKKYIAIVAGVPRKVDLFIDQPIGKDLRRPFRVKVRGAVAKDAQTEVRLIEKIDKHSILAVKILTGRTHQVRVHLEYENLFLMGDELYGRRTDLISRQALHAHHMKFKYKDRYFEFFAELPADMQFLLEKLRGT